MGKAARERARRKAEAEAPPKLIVVEDPATPAPPTVELVDPEPVAAELPDDRVPGQCPVVGCTNLGLCQHDTANGLIWLCGRCDQIARRNLKDEADRQATIDAVVKPVEEQFALRAKERAR